MQISTLRRELGAELQAFAWNQWAQMGVLASTQHRDRRAADPEALLLLTFEVGREDPRLFEEVLDWLVKNERLISVRRLRNLARDDEDRALVEASLGWVAQWRPRARLAAKPARLPHRRADAQPLFRGTRSPSDHPDQTFLAHGLLKAPTKPSGKSQSPDLGAPINFAFRMRSLLGVGARAEVARALVCTSAPRLPVQVITESAAYAKRNVQEALSALLASGVIATSTIANEQRYEAPRERWAEFLGLGIDELPSHEDWPQLFHALRRLLRWLHDPRNEDLSDYMRASEARLLLDEIAPELRYAGVRAHESGAQGAEYWPHFVEVVQSAVAAIGTSG